MEKAKLTLDDVYGKKVRIKYNFGLNEHPLIDAMRKGEVKGFSVSETVPEGVFVPKGAIGVIKQGIYCGGLFNYSIEWPVQFEMFKNDGVKGYSSDYTVGVPHEIIEFIGDDKKGDDLSKLV